MILNTTKTETDVLPNLRKAAILLVALGEGSSAELLQQLNEEEVQKVSREVAKLTAISAEQAESVLEEFHHIANAGDYVARGGIDYARKLLMRAFDPEHAKRLLDRLTKALGADAASFDAIQKADPQQLAKFIHNEHPQTIALVLSHLNYSQAAALLTSLPATMRADISQRMASLDQISPEIILKIAAVIGQKLKALGEFSRESYGGVRAVAEMLNRLDSTSSREILDHIDQQDTNLAETIRHLMFVFEDLLADRSHGPQRSPRQGRSQGAHHRPQGHQRTVAQPHPELHVAARRGHAAGGHGVSRSREDQGSRSRPAEHHRRGAPARKRRRAQSERRGR